MARDHSIRSLLRGLSIMEVLNGRNGATLSDVVEATGLNRGTAYRMLETLCSAGYVRRDTQNSGYWLSPKVRALSDGYHEESWIAEIAQPRMDVLSQEIVWPLTLATALGTQIVIRAITQSPLTFVHVAIGGRLPMVGSAAGRVHLSFMEAPQRRLLLDLIRRSSEDSRDAPAQRPSEMAKIIEKVQKDGYAFYGADRRFSTCAVPIFSRKKCIASLVMRFPTMALRQTDVVKRYLPLVRKCAREIGDEFDLPLIARDSTPATRKVRVA